MSKTTEVVHQNVKMACADEDFIEREFVQDGVDASGKPDYVCTHCGWMQSSTAAGAEELLANATWHSEKERDDFSHKADKFRENTEAETNKAIAVRVLLDPNATLLNAEQTSV